MVLFWGNWKSLWEALRVTPCSWGSAVSVGWEEEQWPLELAVLEAGHQQTLVTIQIEGHVSICAQAKFTEEQKTQRPFSPLSNGNNNNAYLQACEDRMKYLRTGVLQSHNACPVDTRVAGFPEMLAKWDTGQGLSSGRCVVPESMGAWRAQQTWTEVTQCLG